MNTNRQLIEQFLQFINTGDPVIGKPIISDDVIFYAPTSPEPMKGFESYMGVLAMMRGAMPDIQWKIEETISEGDKILVRYTMTGYEFKDGKIIREHGLPDMFSLLMQLGVIPAPGQ